MAGIWSPPTENYPASAIFTLTQAPTPECAPYHVRMPVILSSTIAEVYLRNAGAAADIIQDNNA